MCKKILRGRKNLPYCLIYILKIYGDEQNNAQRLYNG